MKIAGFSAAAVALALALAACKSTDTVGPGACDNSTLKGPFAFETSGMVSPTVHVASVGVSNFDGKGTVNEVSTTSLNGIFTQHAAAAPETYQVAADCTGTIKNSAGVIVENFVLTEGGAELLAIDHLYLFNVSSEYEKIDGACSNSTLHGTYAFQEDADVGTTTMHEVGTMMFDGKSGEAFHAIEEINNAVSTIDEKGSYAVNSDCTGTETESSGSPFTQIVVAHGGAQVVAITTKPGSSEVINLVRKD